MRRARIILFLFFNILLLEVFAQAPVANFSNDISSGCDIAVVKFTDLSTGTPTSWSWDFGNGVTSILQNPTCAYTSPGTYSVDLVSTNASGSSTKTKSNLIVVFKSPTAQYSADKMTGCPPITISLTDISTIGSSAILTRQWDFGNGSFANGPSVKATYNSPGNFFISLHITDANGCESFSINTDSVRLKSKPTASFTSDNQTSCSAPFLVNFTNSSTGSSNLTYLWDFGDGATSGATNPSHTYTTTGSFDVTLTVLDAVGCTEISNNPSYINITGVVNFAANFSCTDTIGCSSNVHFTDLSSVGTNQWLWNFGDGTSSNQKNPTHSYATSGVYTVSLKASNNLSCADKPTDTKIKTVHITINNPSPIDFTIDDSTGCNAPFTVQFTNNSPLASTFLWDFGDGTTSTLANPPHTYNAMGTHNVTLTITDVNGCISTKTKHVFMSIPTLHFAADTTKGCVPLPVKFTETSTSAYAITNWSWDFGNGGTSTQQNPTTIYSDSGSFTVSLTVTDIQGCKNTLVKTGYINPGIKPITSFFAIDTIICHGAPTFFNSTSSDFADKWKWDFGDGTGSDEEDPKHLYQDTGLLSVQLVTEFHGCYDTVFRKDYIRVYPPIPMFFGVPTKSCSAPLLVTFTNLSVGAQTYIWRFGDNSTSILTNPTHTYTDPGLYDVTLVASTNTPKQCTDSLKYTQYIKISSTDAAFTQNTNFNCENGQIDFTSTSVTNTVIYDYIWDFGDGTIDTIHSLNITHTYDSTGLFDVTLSVVDSLGCVTSITKIDTVEIQKKPFASFVADTTKGCVPLGIVFDPTLSSAFNPATLTTWNWNFGDGSPPQTRNNGNKFSYIYNQRSYPGSFSVSLNVIDSKGCQSTFSRTNYITPTFPFPNITYNPIICHYDSLQIINTSSGVGLKYLWDFGDGSTSTLPAPIHSYSVPITQDFNIMLTVTDTNNCDSTITLPIKVSRPISKFDHDSITSNCPPIFVKFNDLSTADVIKWDWTFGDKTTGSILKNPQHVYNKAGLFDATLTVTNNFGCVDYDTIKNIQINGPKGTIDYNPKQGCAPLTVHFTSQSQDASVFLWVFGNGDVASGQNVTYVYPDSGMFIPILSLSDTGGCNFNIVGPDPINVYPLPVADYSKTTECLFNPVTFTDLTKTYQNDAVASWAWDFGDTQSGSGATTGHAYTVNGNYTSTLIVTTARGCKDTISKVVDVFNPSADFSFQNQCVFIPVNFTDNSNSPNLIINTRLWDFGDGTTSGALNPTHTFQTSGDFIVSLTVTDSRGCSHTKTKSITIYPQPVANYTYPTFCPRQSEIFTNTSTDNSGITSSDWTFGDATTSTNKNPIHAYNLSNTYNVRLIVGSGNGCLDTISKSVIVNPLPSTNYLFSDVCEKTKATFVNTSTISSGNIVTNAWNMGNGVLLNSITDTLLYTYNTDGVYSVKLKTVSDSGCMDSITKSITIFASPIVDFSFHNQCVFVPEDFTDNSSSPNFSISTRLWNFGDGSTSGITNPPHSYSISGNYNIKLKATDTKGCSDSATKSITIFPQPIANYTYPTFCPRQGEIFTNTSTDNSGITSSSWTFGDATTSTDKNPVHAFNLSNTYNVRLIVGSANGCLDTISKNVIVNPSPVTNFVVSSVCEKVKASFVNKSTISSGSIDNDTWTMGNGVELSSSADTLLYTYNFGGEYSVMLKTVSDSGCMDSITKTITVYKNPTANFSSNKICHGASTTLTDLSVANEGLLSSWKWDFGDTTTATFQNGIHLFARAGDHPVKLEVTSSFGCKNETTLNVHVNFNPIAAFDFPDTVCEKQQVLFVNNSIDPADGINDTWRWRFGDKGTSQIKEPTHAYLVGGSYKIDLKVQSNTGCTDSLQKPIFVLKSPISLFSLDPPSTTLITPEITFTNASIDGVRWRWDFGDNDSSTLKNPKHEYADTGTYKVILYAYNDLECPDSMSVKVIINPEFTFYIPNAFTPTSNNVNENFNGYGICIAEYELRIYNRWGELIFLSNDKNEGWNGRKFNKMSNSPIGVYSYVFVITDYKKKYHRFIGSVTLVR